MPWQAHLYVGVEVSSEKEALKIYNDLGITPDTPRNGGVFGGAGKEYFISLRGKQHRVYLYAMQENEGGSNTFAVAFALTGRYGPEVLDAPIEENEDAPGRPEIFVFDPDELNDILNQVRPWFKDAKVFMWDRFH